MSRPGFGFWGELESAFRLFQQGIDFPPSFDRSLESELHELLAPHLAVLVYKRGKFAGSDRWVQDLEEFVDGEIRPYLSPANASVRRLEKIVDRLIASHQTTSALADIMPLTSRFDTSWAM